MESKQEETDQDQQTPKLVVTKESTEKKKDTSKLSESNEKEFGRIKSWQLETWLYQSEIKKSIESKIVKNQSIQVVKIIGESKKLINLAKY